jgi:IPT/TIG domain
MSRHLPAGKLSLPTDIIVSVGNFHTAAHSTDGFTFTKLGIDHLAPLTGPLAGGTKVTLTGAGFTDATAVSLKVGSHVLSLTPTIVSDTSIDVVTPNVANLSGLGTDAVKARLAVTAGGETSPPATFTDLPPAITNVAPASGVLVGGTRVTLTGSGFTGASKVRMMLGSRTFVVTVTRRSDTSVTFVTPGVGSLKGLPAGSIHAKISVAVGLYSSAISARSVFTYLRPVIATVAPPTGPLAGGTKVSLTGSAFTGVTKVRVGVGSHFLLVPATVRSDRTITFSTPRIATLLGLPPGSVRAQISVLVGLYSSTSSGTTVFTYVFPTITKVAPLSGPLAGGTKITLTGAGFTGANTVHVTAGSHSLTVTASVLNDRSISFAAPSVANLAGLPAGSFRAQVSVTVGLYGSAATAHSVFTYQPPAVASLTPTKGPTAGGTKVTLTGAGFTGAAKVRLTIGSHKLLTAATVRSDQSITFLTPRMTSLTGLPAGSIRAQVSVLVGLYASATSTHTVFTYLRPAKH